MPTKRIVKPFGGDNKPIIKRASKSTKTATISLRYPITSEEIQQALLNYTARGSAEEINKRSGETTTNTTPNNTASSINHHNDKWHKQGDAKLARTPLQDVTNLSHTIRSNRRQSHSSSKERQSSKSTSKIQRHNHHDWNANQIASQIVYQLEGTCIERQKINDVKKKNEASSDSRLLPTRKAKASSMPVTTHESQITPKINNRGKKLKHDTTNKHKNKASFTSSDMECSASVTEIGESVNNESLTDEMNEYELQNHDNDNSSFCMNTGPTSVKGKEMKKTPNVNSKEVLQLLLNSCDDCDTSSNKRHYIVNQRRRSSRHSHGADHQAKPNILGSDVIMIQSSESNHDDESEVTADTALKTLPTKADTHNMDSNKPVLQRSQNDDYDSNSYLSVNEAHPELPPGWTVYLSRSKNRPYYVHPDHGATWYFPGSNAGWRKEYSKTSKRVYYVHPDHGKSWFCPTSYSSKNDDIENVDTNKNTNGNYEQPNDCVDFEIDNEEITNVDVWTTQSRLRAKRLSTNVIMRDTTIDRGCDTCIQTQALNNTSLIIANSEEKHIPIENSSIDVLKNGDIEIPAKVQVREVALSQPKKSRSSSTCFDDLKLECQLDAYNDTVNNSPDAIEYNLSSPNEIEYMNGTEITRTEHFDAFERTESSIETKNHNHMEEESSSNEDLISNEEFKKTTTGARDEEKLKQDIFGHNSLPGEGGYPSENLQSGEYINVSFKLKVLSPRVLNTNPICSLQTLSEFLLEDKQPTLLTGRKKRKLQKGNSHLWKRSKRIS